MCFFWGPSIGRGSLRRPTLRTALAKRGRGSSARWWRYDSFRGNWTIPFIIICFKYTVVSVFGRATKPTSANLDRGTILRATTARCR